MRPISVFVAGQSFASPMVSGHAKDVLISTLEDGFSDVVVNGYAIGGSAAQKTHAPQAHPDRWWFDIDSGAEGPALIAAKAVIQASNTAYDCILWLQGEADSVWDKSNPSGNDRATDQNELDKFYLASRQIIWRLRKAANPLSPTSVQVMSIHIGRRIGWVADGVQAIRDTQYKLIASSPDLFPMPGIYDLQLIGEIDGTTNVHHTVEGEVQYAVRAGDAVKELYGVHTMTKAPRFLSAEQKDNETIRIKFQSETPLSQPAIPEGFAFAHAGVVYTKAELAFSYENDILCITAPVSIIGMVEILFPYGQGDNYILEDIIKDENNTPITPFSHTINTVSMCHDNMLDEIIEKYGSVRCAVYKLLHQHNMI